MEAVRAKEKAARANSSKKASITLTRLSARPSAPLPRIPSHKELMAEWDSGDHLHPSDSG